MSYYLFPSPTIIDLVEHMRQYEQQIRKGAALLDEKIPWWRARIDIEELHTAGGCSCILGQLFIHEGGYFDGALALFRPGLEAKDAHLISTTEIDAEATAHGFQVNRLIDQGYFAEHEILTREWKSYLRGEWQ